MGERNAVEVPSDPIDATKAGWSWQAGSPRMLPRSGLGATPPAPTGGTRSKPYPVALRPQQLGGLPGRSTCMPFDHDRLEAYEVVLEFLDLADIIVEQPRHHGGRSNLADPLGRPALSIVNNIAGGGGRNSEPDKRRFYATAIGSADRVRPC